jgi:putative endonuclease
VGKEYFVYALISLKDKNLYIGHTDDLDRRVKAHNAGKMFSTRPRRPFKLLYYEVLDSREKAIKREKFLKSGCGRELIKAQGR